MLKQLNRCRRMLHLLVGVAALVIGSAQVLADRHLHDTAVPEDVCQLCGVFGSAVAPDANGPALEAQSWAAVDYPGMVAAPLVSRPFEYSLSRAPPLS